MTDEWIEPKAKIPFVGIVAMVLIVAVVAVFIKTQLAPFFPASDVTVEGGVENIAGRASASFYGMREIPLSKKEYLQAVMNTNAGGVTYTIDAAEKLLTVSTGGKREEVLLHDEDGQLAATYDSNGIQTQVLIDPMAMSMRVNEPGKSVGFTTVGLSELVVYQGMFTMRTKQYLFQFSPAEPQAIIVGEKIEKTPLTNSNGIYSGIWRETSSHPISIDANKRIATIEEII